MVPEIAIIAGSSLAGAVSAAIMNKISKSKAVSKKNHDQGQQLFARPASSIKSEFSSLQFEKALVGEALTRVYEAFQDGRIDRVERDRLLVKYKQQLDSLNQKIGGIEPSSDIVNLVDVRNSLVTLLEERISAIDTKLAEMSGKGGNIKHEVRSQQISVVLEEKQPIRQPVRETKSADEKNIAQLQSEIMTALYRLEQVELDKD